MSNSLSPEFPKDCSGCPKITQLNAELGQIAIDRQNVIEGTTTVMEAMDMLDRKPNKSPDDEHTIEQGTRVNGWLPEALLNIYDVEATALREAKVLLQDTCNQPAEVRRYGLFGRKILKCTSTS